MHTQNNTNMILEEQQFEHVSPIEKIVFYCHISPGGHIHKIEWISILKFKIIIWFIHHTVIILYYIMWFLGTTIVLFRRFICETILFLGLADCPALQWPQFGKVLWNALHPPSAKFIQELSRQPASRIIWSLCAFPHLRVVVRPLLLTARCPWKCVM